jgi:DNA replication protein DnaC
MAKFCHKPSDLILMQGNPGSGKTYSAMGMCELFTRNSTSCIFVTQVKLWDKWLEVSSGGDKHFIERIKSVNLLVIDDFGTAEVSPAFLKFFMEIINERLQWTDRGTVITTNLLNEKWGEFCGEALTDRISMGQLFTFEDSSRRHKKPI